MKNVAIKNWIFVIFIVTILLISGCNIKDVTIKENGIKKFSSVDELKNFLKARQQQGYYGGYGFEKAATGPQVLGAETTAAGISDARASTYSTTNIQVQGVDEPDIVKNDGKYVYTVSQEKIHIIDAYPPKNMELLSSIDVNGTVNEIFVNNDKLIVFGQEKYIYEPLPLAEKSISIDSPTVIGPMYYQSKSFVKTYDISNKKAPELFNSITYDGSYFDARMIDNYVYVILNQPIVYQKDNIYLPEIKSASRPIQISPRDIYYFDIYDDSYRLTTMMSININSNSDPEIKTFLTGYTQNIFVSKENIYLTSQKYISTIDYQERLMERVLVPLVDSTTADKINDILKSDIPYYEKQAQIDAILELYYNKLSESEKKDLMKKIQEKTTEVQAEIQKETQKTIIHKISIYNKNVEYKTRGEVPGVILNQFSMDEYKDNFRIATTTGEIFGGTSLNHIYVLDEDLDIIGKIEDLAPKERIYSVRFLGERAYMVTFKKIDPLFVIDLKNPENPKLLGQLKIPGYSDYLHPYDENHIIGIGKEAVDAISEERNGRETDFAWYQGIKIALFDVSNPENPKEISKYNLGDRGTDSDALYDHRAFLFDKEKQLLVIPITLAEIDKSEYPNEIPPYAYGKTTFQGAYVFSINSNEGIKLKGSITHSDTDEIKEKGYYDYLTKISRSLYMDGILYTISTKKVKANDLNDLDELNSIELPIERQNPQEVIAY